MSRGRKKTKEATPFLRFLFVLYAALLLWLLFDRPIARDPMLDYAETMRGNINLIPLHTIKSYWGIVKRMEFTPMFYHCFVNLGGNIFLFIPIGYFMPKIWPFLRKFFSFLLAGVMAITLVELLQLVTLLGSLDIDDLILNLGGMLIGYVLFMLFQKRGKR